MARKWSWERFDALIPGGVMSIFALVSIVQRDLIVPPTDPRDT